MGLDIVRFKNILAGLQSTVSIAIGDANFGSEVVLGILARTAQRGT